MEEFKKIIKTVIGPSDPFERIFYGQPCEQTYELGVILYNKIQNQKKDTLIARCFKKLNKEKPSHQIIKILYLIQKISEGSKVSQLNRISCFLDQQSKIYPQPAKKGDKIEVAQIQFVKFYYDILRNNLWKDHSIDVTSPQCPMTVLLQQAQLSMQMIISLMQNEFILNYLITHYQKQDVSNNILQQPLVLSICRNIMNKSIEQFSQVIKFVNKWCSMITQNFEHSIAINQLYEKTIHVDRDIKKLDVLLRKLKIQRQYQKFSINKELNLSIENAMMNRKGQCKAFKTEKNIKTKKFIPLANDDEEEDILIQYGEFM